MMFETERKFLVAADFRHSELDAEEVVQGYLPHDRDDFDLRVRRRGAAGALAIKSRSTSVTRIDIEFAIPVALVDVLLGVVPEEMLIRKTRHTVSHAGRVWTVDAFQHPNPGLLLAEVEVEGPDDEPELPPWAGREVTGDPRYYNSYMAAGARCVTR